MKARSVVFKGLTDFNDLGQARGRITVSQAIEDAVSKLLQQTRVIAVVPNQDLAMAM